MNDDQFGQPAPGDPFTIDRTPPVPPPPPDAPVFSSVLGPTPPPVPPVPPVPPGPGPVDDRASAASPVRTMDSTSWSFGGGTASRSSVGSRSFHVPSLRMPKHSEGAKATRRPVAIGLVVLLVAGAAYWFLSRGPDSKAMAMSFYQGQTVSYHLAMNFDGHLTVAGQAVPLSLSVDGTVAWHVDSVDPSGTATIEASELGMKVTTNGKPEGSSPAETTTIRIAKDGRILQAGDLGFANGGTSSPTLLFPGSDQYTPLLPSGKVKPGDSWTKSFAQAFPFGTGDLRYNAEITYVRDDIVGGKRTAVLTSTISFPTTFTLDLRKLMQLSGDTADAKSIPARFDPQIRYSGGGSETQTASFDPKAGELLRSSENGHFDIGMTLLGFPKGTIPPKLQSMRLAGGITIVLERSLGASSN